MKIESVRMVREEEISPTGDSKIRRSPREKVDDIIHDARDLSRNNLLRAVLLSNKLRKQELDAYARAQAVLTAHPDVNYHLAEAFLDNGIAEEL